jgi:hypothetical protein
MHPNNKRLVNLNFYRQLQTPLDFFSGGRLRMINDSAVVENYETAQSAYLPSSNRNIPYCHNWYVSFRYAEALPDDVSWGIYLSLDQIAMLADQLCAAGLNTNFAYITAQKVLKYGQLASFELDLLFSKIDQKMHSLGLHKQYSSRSLDMQYHLMPRFDLYGATKLLYDLEKALPYTSSIMGPVSTCLGIGALTGDLAKDVYESPIREYLRYIDFPPENVSGIVTSLLSDVNRNSTLRPPGLIFPPTFYFARKDESEP